MQLGQAIRRFNDQMRALRAALAGAFGRAVPPGLEGTLPRNFFARALLLLVGALVLYFGVGALLMHNIDDKRDFAVDSENVLEGESESVAFASALLDREINRHGWVANDPFYLPTSLLWNMAAYQTGIIATALHFTETVGQAMTARGTPSSDLDAAALRLSRPGDVWEWDLSEPLGFLGRSENQYREGILALEGFNVAVADGTIAFARDGAMLLAILDGFSQSIDEAVDRLTEEARGGLVFFDTDVSDAFYSAKGVAYTEFAISKGIRSDFGAVMRAHDAMAQFEAVQAALWDAAALSPGLLANGRPDGALFPSHPYIAGYFLLRAKDALDTLAVKLRQG